MQQHSFGECFSILLVASNASSLLPCSVVYRRHLADDADLQHSEADEMARRWPVAWLILRPAKYGPRHQLPTQVQSTAIRMLTDESLEKTAGCASYAACDVAQCSCPHKML